MWADSYARDDYHNRIYYPYNAAASGCNRPCLFADHHDHHHFVTRRYGAEAIHDNVLARGNSLRRVLNSIDLLAGAVEASQVSSFTALPSLGLALYS